MVRIENDCVGCDLPCISSCPYREVEHYYCDECKGDVAALYFRKSDYHYNEYVIDENSYGLCEDCAVGAITFDDIIEYVDEDFVETDKRWFYCFYDNSELDKELEGLHYTEQDKKIAELSDEYVAKCREKYIKSNDIEYGLQTIRDMCCESELLDHIYYIYER